MVSFSLRHKKRKEHQTMTHSPQKNILSEHEVSTVVLNCIDFRFRSGAPTALKKTFGVDTYDEIKLAGGAKNVATPGRSEARRVVVMEDIDLAIKAHHATRVILLNHQNCGKYASEGSKFTDMGAERTFHQEELARAAAIVQGSYPFAEVRTGFMYVEDDGVTVAIEEFQR